MKNQGFILWLSYGYVAVILWCGFRFGRTYRGDFLL